MRNDGPDPVAIRQAIVNDAFVGFSQSDPEIDRLRGGTVTIDYPWIEGQAYAISLVTATGGTVDAADRRGRRDSRRPTSASSA